MLAWKWSYMFIRFHLKILHKYCNKNDISKKKKESKI